MYGKRWKAALAAAIVCCALSAHARTQEIHWSPTAPYHDSVVRLWQKGKTGGSGVLIGANDTRTLGYVLTTISATSNDDYVGVQWQDGTTSVGAVLVQDAESELAILTCDPPEDCTVARIAGSPPEKGLVCDHVATSPEDVRTYFGQWIREDDWAYTNATAAATDNGGGVFADGRLCGLIVGGQYTVDGENASFPARSTPLAAVKSLVRDVNNMPADMVLVAQNAVPPNYFEFLGQEPQQPRPSQPIERDPPTPDPVTVPAQPTATTTTAATTQLQPDQAPPAAVARPPAPSSPVTATTTKIVSIDTELIARAVLEHIQNNDMMPPQKIDDAEFLIRLADRLTADPEFIRLVSERVLDRLEQRVLARIGKTILDSSK